MKNKGALGRGEVVGGKWGYLGYSNENEFEDLKCVNELANCTHAWNVPERGVCLEVQGTSRSIMAKVARAGVSLAL